MNLYNCMPAKEVVILGSGDIGMIMARRLTLEGAHVQAVFEIQPYPSGLPRNIEQCLNDYGIPLYLSHTVTDIHGDARLTGVTVSEVDDHLRPIPGSEKEYSCDTLILSVGLLPENELSLAAGVELDARTGGAFVDENYQTSREGIFAAGNVLHVHDLVDFVSLEAENLADAAARYIKEGTLSPCPIELHTDQNIGHRCPKGENYVKQEFSAPVRSISSTVLVEGGELPLTSVRLTKPIPRERIFDAMREIRKVKVKAPVSIGTVVIKGILGYDSGVIVTKNVALRATP